MNRLQLPALMLVTEPSNKLPWIVSEALSGGVSMVQWRQKTGVGSGFNRAYAGLQAVTQDAVPLIANTSWDVAQRIRVPNLHLPEKSAPISAARKLVGLRGLVGKSVHSVDSAITAEAEGADYLIAGTIFASLSHPTVEPMGLDFLKAVCDAVKLPVLAIGGIKIDAVAGCIAAGASGVAILSPIMLAKEPSLVAQQYRTALNKVWISKNEIDS